MWSYIRQIARRIDGYNESNNGSNNGFSPWGYCCCCQKKSGKMKHASWHIIGTRGLTLASTYIITHDSMVQKDNVGSILTLKPQKGECWSRQKKCLEVKLRSSPVAPLSVVLKSSSVSPCMRSISDALVFLCQILDGTIEEWVYWRFSRTSLRKPRKKLTGSAWIFWREFASFWRSFEKAINHSSIAWKQIRNDWRITHHCSSSTLRMKERLTVQIRFKLRLESVTFFCHVTLFSFSTYSTSWRCSTWNKSRFLYYLSMLRW